MGALLSKVRRLRPDLLDAAQDASAVELDESIATLEETVRDLRRERRRHRDEPEVPEGDRYGH